MTAVLTVPALTAVSELLAARLGLHFPPARWADLERGLAGAARTFGYRDTAACIQELLTAPLTAAQITVLADHLTIGETYFFREPPSFAALETTVLADLIATRRAAGTRRLRLWSAGCCTGEEAYSLAILLHRMLPDWQTWDITILATDLNPRFLEQAMVGEYGPWSFRALPPDDRDQYFERAGDGRYVVRPVIRQMVRFSVLNLADPGYPAAPHGTADLDLICCRNVLMYFAPEATRRVVQRFHQALIPGGWLVVGLCETSQELFTPFAPVNLPGATFYRKLDHRPAVPALPAAWLPGGPPARCFLLRWPSPR